ncbi:MAG: hypothetical protein R3F48_09200 [Candidatus Zixiibacteriota bacterium]
MFSINAKREYLVKTVMVCALSLFFLTAFIIAGDVSSQLKIPAEGNKQILTLTDGSTLIGKIKEVQENTIVFVTDMGEITVDIEKIVEVKEIAEKSIKEGKYWFDNPNQTRLYFGPTGRMLKKGEGYFADVYLFFPSVTYGVTDNITVSGGVSIFPTDDIGEQIIYFTPKIGFNSSPKLAFAASAFIVRVPDWFGDDDDIDNDGDDDIVDVLGILFATTTYGTPDKSITFGLGFGFADSEIADKPAVQIGGEYRLARRMSFVTENWVFPEVDQPLLSYGLRFFGENMAVDLALFNVLDEDAVVPGIPYIDFVYNF